MTEKDPPGTPRNGAQPETDAAATAAAGEAGSPPGEAELQAKLAEIQARVAEKHEEFLRALAEVENVRRRAAQDVERARKYALEGFAQELLGVRDSLDQAAQVEISADTVEQMREGLGLTLRLLDSAFSRFHIETVSPEPGDRFDPESHQAVTTRESDQVEPNAVVEVVQKGYRLNDRLLRPAMVVVARAPAADGGGSGGAESA
ncbi:MAG: nucleotide exchange factor GrpE [Gammaproteobacteria bacterium]|jgi:molecular chaperone GrpE|nr:nucleotide exchange factor GrpE [Gammaproteobacteria bacterium]